MAASRYIASGAQPKTFLAEAYVAEVEAYLRLKQESAALVQALAMLDRVPYNAETGECIDEALAYMRFVHTSDAIELAKARQPLLLVMLRSSAIPPAASSAAIASGGAPTAASGLSQTGLSIHDLYSSGLALPTLEQLANEPQQAQSAMAALEAALPSSLGGDDALLIAQARTHYALLGKPLTGIAPLTSLSMPVNRVPKLPANGTITAMLLFPDWCAPCVRLGPQLPQTVFTVEGHSAYLYALLAETVPPRTPDPKLTNTAFNPAFSAAGLAETPTVTVRADTLNRFAASDYPLLLLTDSRGILRGLQPISAQDVQQGETWMPPSLWWAGISIPRRRPTRPRTRRPLRRSRENARFTLLSFL